MIVYFKNGDCALKVYDVKCNKHGYPHFLVYYLGQWRYISAKYFSPMDRW